MALALSLGRRHLGRTWPNPSVGAVLVRDRSNAPVIVGQGATAPGGRPHAEAVAIERAGLAAFGATLYVTLEPCAHRSVRGGTPCVEATIGAGIARVVSAIEDPNPEIAGLGHALLRSTGVQVETGLMREAAARDHRGHFTRIIRGRPTLTLKLARTPDGFSGVTSGARLMITGPETQARVHLMRAHADAVLVGIGTVVADDPLLDVRLPGLGARSPIRIVLDSKLRLSPGSRLAASANRVPTWIVTSVSAPVAAERALKQAGIEVLRVEAGPDGRVDLAATMQLLAARGLTRIFCEGGPLLADALAGADLIDECVLATGPAPLGGPGVPAFGPRLEAVFRERFRLIEEVASGPDRIAHFERI